ncbi:hypothetical protein GBAR_LOCUS5863 [Geodia barretti]|uniref:Uncharacterized protein n=1 Tax=Geodia barretti TaxID=519541 RepID=A0AA35RBU0_GEOBA|nr:hypothetical protein GBAR_LOCUS5863 [Geodia barretti]
MRTEYQISGSTPVTSRENGALHEMVTELALLITLISPTADSGPKICHCGIVTLHEGATIYHTQTLNYTSIVLGSSWDGQIRHQNTFRSSNL